MWFVGLSLVGFACSFHLVVLLQVVSFSDLGFHLVHAHFLSLLAVVVGFVLEWCMTRGFRGLLGPLFSGFRRCSEGSLCEWGCGSFSCARVCYSVWFVFRLFVSSYFVRCFVPLLGLVCWL